MDKQTFSRDRHWTTSALVDVFAALEEGVTVPYAELAKRCNIDEESVRRRVQSAKKIALRDHHVVIDVVRNVGVARLAQNDVTAPVGRAIGRMRSAARTGHRLIQHGVTDFEKLPPDTKSEIFMQRAVVGTVLLVTDRASRRMLKEHASETNSEIKIGRTLEMLR